ncbi:MAG TPA: OmpH family outer membrane protein [Trueperaceae bacterium]|nr:OmpH family outer membrane protein [Trueperaceae bacterium]
MKNLPILLFLLSLSFVSFVSAQQAPKIAFVRPTALIQAYGPDTEAAKLVQERDTELQGLATEISQLQAKASTDAGLTADERARASMLVNTFEAAQKRYEEDINKASEPILKEIDTAIKTVAKAQGYDLVFDAEAVNASGLIVYANFDVMPDITDLVVAQIKANLGQ